jgi:hypothetical protein
MSEPYLVVCAFWTKAHGADKTIGDAARALKVHGTRGAAVTFPLSEADRLDFRHTMRRLQLEEVNERPAELGGTDA